MIAQLSAVAVKRRNTLAFFFLHLCFSSVAGNTVFEVWILVFTSTILTQSVHLIRHIYWTDWADRAYIGRAGMDGKEKTVIISTKLEWPNGLTIDYTNDKLYWTDAHLNYIEYVHRNY